VAGRAGLVGTQNIRNNQSRVGGLDYIARTGTIIEAVKNQPWSGEANVHVSIANWVKTQDAALLPKTRKLWFKVEPSAAAKRLRKRGTGPAGKDYELDYRECALINSALSDEADVSGAKILRYANASAVVCQGVTPGHDGFVITAQEAERMINSDNTSKEVVFPYLIGREILTGAGQLDRFIIDFGRRSILDAQHYEMPFAHVQHHVLSDVQKRADLEHKSESAHKDHLDHWWLH
jgi:hypothetical protein